MTTRDSVTTWFRERLANGPLARDTEAYNQVSSALDDLVARLEAASPAPAPAPEPLTRTAAPVSASPKGEAAPAPDPEPEPEAAPAVEA